MESNMARKILFLLKVMKVGILLTFAKHVHECINSLKEEVWGCKTSLIPPLFNWSTCTKSGKWAVMYFYGRVSNLPLSTIFALDFGTVRFITNHLDLYFQR